MSRPYCHHFEQRAERSESVGSAARPESVVRPAKAFETLAYHDSLNNIGHLSLLIDSSADTSEATTGSSRLEGFKVVGIQPDNGGEEESVACGIPGCGQKTDSD